MDYKLRLYDVGNTTRSNFVCARNPEDAVRIFKLHSPTTRIIKHTDDITDSAIKDEKAGRVVGITPILQGKERGICSISLGGRLTIEEIIAGEVMRGPACWQVHSVVGM